MNIKELKETIKDLPDNMLVGGSGHYGEYLKVEHIDVREAWTCECSKCVDSTCYQYL